MGFGSPRKARASRPTSERRPFRIVLAFAFVPLLALNLPAIHALDQSWAVAAGAAAPAALVSAVFVAMWFANGDWFDLKYYGWKRGLLLVVLAAACSVVLHLIVAWPAITIVAGGLFAALLACMLLMIASGDLRV
jgi:hypothetical protein